MSTSLLQLIDRPGGVSIKEIIGPVRIVDVGATEYAGSDAPPYQPLRALPCTIVGFDPENGDPALADTGILTLPLAIADGRRHTLRQCASPMTSSLLEPNEPWLARFENLAQLCKVVDHLEISTVRLDDVQEVKGAEYLKIDVQGATLLVLENAIETLGSTLVVHTEVEFAELYQSQPQFGDIAKFLADNGFEFHHFRDFGSSRELGKTKEFAFGKKASRHLWADAVFVPNEVRLDLLNDRELLLLALILNDCYGVEDLAHACLTRIDMRNGTNLSEQYRAAVLAHEVTAR